MYSFRSLTFCSDIAEQSSSSYHSYMKECSTLIFTHCWRSPHHPLSIAPRNTPQAGKLEGCRNQPQTKGWPNTIGLITHSKRSDRNSACENNTARVNAFPLRAKRPIFQRRSRGSATSIHDERAPSLSTSHEDKRRLSPWFYSLDSMDLIE